MALAKTVNGIFSIKLPSHTLAGLAGVSMQIMVTIERILASMSTR